LVIKSGSLLIQNIDSTIVTILEKNTVLQPAIYFGNRNKLIQVKSIINNKNDSFQLTRTNVQSTDEIITLLKNEATNHFPQLDQRFIVRYHLIKMGTDDDEEYLKPNDLIIFVFHQTAFDYNFVDPFIVAFTEVYNQTQFHVMNLQYSDFTLYEDGQLNGISQNATMNGARQSRSEQVNGYNQKEQYSLLTTSTQKTKKHSKRGYSVGFDPNSNLAQAQSEFASLHNMSMFHLRLACYYFSLYELSNCTINDLCIVCSSVEMKSMSGMFVNILSYCIEIEPNDSFIDFLKRICQLCKDDVFEHARLPYQLIMNDTDDLYPPRISFHF
jgi:hypothetical protein